MFPYAVTRVAITFRTSDLAGRRWFSQRNLLAEALAGVRAYFKELAAKVRGFLAEEKLREIVLGCREYLWG